MKKDSKKNKLSLTKMNITKLTNPHVVWGGTGDAPDDGTDKDFTNPQKPPECKNDSKDWEQP